MYAFNDNRNMAHEMRVYVWPILLNVNEYRLKRIRFSLNNPRTHRRNYHTGR